MTESIDDGTLLVLVLLGAALIVASVFGISMIRDRQHRDNTSQFIHACLMLWMESHLHMLRRDMPALEAARTRASRMLVPGKPPPFPPMGEIRPRPQGRV